MFNKIPMALMKTTKLVEPAEINGNGKPVGGMEPVTTATLLTNCTAITVAIPDASKQPNLSVALNAIFMAWIIMIKKLFEW